MLFQRLMKYLFILKEFIKEKMVVEYHAGITSVKIKLGEKEYFYASIRDITEQKEIEAKILDTTLKLELATTASKQGIWRLNFATNSLELDDNMYKNLWNNSTKRYK